MKKYLLIIPITIVILVSTFGITAFGLNFVNKDIRTIRPPELFKFSKKWQDKLNLSKNLTGGIEGYGFKNTNVSNDTLRVNFAKGSVSPSYNNENSVHGGLSSYLNLKNKESKLAKLEYSIKFAPKFDFVKGGKLPGLCSDSCPTGGKIVDNNGFSARLMWRKNGDVEAYTYLPKDQLPLENIFYNTDKGLSMGRGKFNFQPDRWYKVTQVIKLNDLNQNNGKLIVSITDDKKKTTEILNYDNIKFVENSSNKIDKIALSSFFGGNDSSWASSKNTYLDIRTCPKSPTLVKLL